MCVDGTKPLSCRARLSRNGSGVVLKSEHRNWQGDVISIEEVHAYRVYELECFNVPSAKCSLLKCALVVLGLVTAEQITTNRDQGLLSEVLTGFCNIDDSSSLGLHVVVTSLLPHGSGMGGSSILAGCVLASVGKCLGIEFTSGPESAVGTNDAIQAVIALEQILTTGGGHQDQANGLFPGAKTVTCNPLEFPLNISIDPIQLDSVFAQTLNENLLLIFTGQTRLAKGILSQCLRRWSTRSQAIVENVKGLNSNALLARHALEDSSLEQLGKAFEIYWSQKKVMAGGDSGVEPRLVKRIIEQLHSKKHIHGASLCGAGGGGFLALIKSETISLTEIRSTLDETIQSEGLIDGVLSIHSCSISKQGLTIDLLPESVVGDDVFDIAWLVAN